MAATMRDVRLASVILLEVLCGKKEIPQERRTELTDLQVGLQKKICEDLGVSEEAGCLSRLPDYVQISQEATVILEKIAGNLAAA